MENRRVNAVKSENVLDLRTTGAEFASETVVKATQHKLQIAEVPITLSPDGRSRRPHLRSWRNSDAEFDQYADDYEAALARGLSVSGEGLEFFARGRIAWLKTHVQTSLGTPRAVMDFGSGTGSSVPFLLDILGAESVIGIDVSARSNELAKQSHHDERVRFLLPDEHQPDEQIDLAFSNGTFHHIPPGQRAAAVNYIHRALRPGGLFALWENNPWNPGTRYIMSRCPLDQDAIPISPLEARRLVQEEGFEVLSTEFLFIFPRVLRWLRPLEQLVSRLPLGGQYQVLCRKRS